MLHYPANRCLKSTKDVVGEKWCGFSNELKCLRKAGHSGPHLVQNRDSDYALILWDVRDSGEVRSRPIHKAKWAIRYLFGDEKTEETPEPD